MLLVLSIIIMYYCAIIQVEVDLDLAASTMSRKIFQFRCWWCILSVSLFKLTTYSNFLYHQKAENFLYMPIKFNLLYLNIFSSHNVFLIQQIIITVKSKTLLFLHRLHCKQRPKLGHYNQDIWFLKFSQYISKGFSIG